METTKDGVLIMGRRCYEDFEGFAKTRKVIALSKDKSIEFPNAIKASSLQDGLAIAQKMNKPFGSVEVEEFTKKHFLWQMNFI